MPGGYSAQYPNWAGIAGEGAFPDMLKALFYKSSFGEPAYKAMQGLLDPDAWKQQYQQGRDILGMDRAMAGQRLGQEMAGRGMYRQGPMSKGLKGLEGQYQQSLTQLLGSTQQAGLQKQQQMLQMLLQMVMGGEQLDIQQQYADRSWLGSLFEGIGNLGGAAIGKWGGG